MKRVIIGLTILLVVLLAASWILMDNQSMPTLLTVEFHMGEAYERISAWQNDNGEWYVFLPAYADLSTATIAFDEDFSVAIDGCVLHNGMSCEDFSLDVQYELSYQSWYTTKTTKIQFLQSENVATMHIDTQSGNMEYIHSKKGNTEDAVIRLYNDTGAILYQGASASVKGRGNATWEDYEKKPYSLEFLEEVDLLQMGAAQKWILLANSTDPTHLKNKAIYDFADSLGLAYSPDSQWVDLYLNGEYVGLYLLSERNEIHSERIAIEEDGWLVSAEIEDRLIRQKYPYVSTREGICLRIHEPDAVTTQQDAMQALWQSIENAIVAEDGIDAVTGRSLLDLIDLDSWVRRYLVDEVFANGDACAISQYYYTPNPAGLTYAGPVWDMDYTMSPRGEWRLSYPNLLAARLKDQRPIWFYELYQKDEFYDSVVHIYQKEVRPMLLDLIEKTLKMHSEKIASSALMNRIRWNVPYGMEEELDRSMEYLFQRIQFLDQLWIDNTEMVSVQINSFGRYPGNILIPVGSSVGHELVNPPENEYQVFQGWFFADTGEPFDKDRLLYEDVEVFAKWEDSTNKKMGQVAKLLPLAVIAVIGVGLVCVAFKRMRKSG